MSDVLNHLTEIDDLDGGEIFQAASAAESMAGVARGLAKEKIAQLFEEVAGRLFACSREKFLAEGAAPVRSTEEAKAALAQAKRKHLN